MRGLRVQGMRAQGFGFGAAGSRGRPCGLDRVMYVFVKTTVHESLKRISGYI